MRNINRFRLRAHTLKVEAAAWIENAMVFAYVTSVLVKMTFFDNFSAAQPFLLQQVNNQLVHDFLSQQNNILFLFLSELMDLFVAGRDQSAADQPNYLAEGHPPL